ncbi:MAG TPA: PQQ-dependent sugar dehydrogenase [Flavobacterium sp.]|jgi:glucose/arabinose dehydrogenase
MKNFLYIAPIAILCCACNSTTTKTVTSNAPVANTADTILPPVETLAPNSDYKSAFAGQTRIGGAKTRTPYQSRTISSNLNKPWSVTSLPDGRLLITEKEGALRIVTTAGNIGAPITGLPAVNSKGQGGLLDTALDPAFGTNRMIYWTFSENNKPGNLTAVAKGRLSDDEKKLENVSVIYRATPAYNGTLHYGSRIIFDRQGNIVISTGERSDLETRPQAQSLNSGLGKIIRITTDGKPATGNPYLSRKDARPEIYSYGHRNPQGLALHPETGDIWESEMGPKGGDEVNLIKPGLNYGWPTITYGIEYSGAQISGGATQKAGLEQPVYYWDPVISCSGMTFYSGNAIPEWKNNLFIGGLSSRHIIRLVIENNKVVGEERLLADQEQRFRDITQGTDGALYAVTDEGRLYRIGK